MKSASDGTIFAFWPKQLFLAVLEGPWVQFNVRLYCMFNIFLTKIGILQTPRVYKDLQVKARPAFQTAGISMNGQVAKRVRCGFQPHKSPLTTCFERNDILRFSSATFCSLLSLLRYTSLRLQLIPTPLCNIGEKGERSVFPSRHSDRPTP